MRALARFAGLALLLTVGLNIAINPGVRQEAALPAGPNLQSSSPVILLSSLGPAVALADSDGGGGGGGDPQPCILEEGYGYYSYHLSNCLCQDGWHVYVVCEPTGGPVCPFQACNWGGI